jgi:16S rRNA processing protein RimM
VEKVRIGRIGKPYGMEGGVKFRGEAVVFDLEKVYLDGLGYRIVEEVQELNQEVVLYLSGVKNRTEAERIAALEVWAEKSDLPALAQGEYYYFELIGQAVFVDGKPFGSVVDIEDGVQERLVIQASGESLRAQRRFMVPLQAPYVSLQKDGIYIEPIPGLLD